MRKIIICTTLGILTFFAITALDNLTYDSSFIAVQDILNLPGIFIYGVIWPEGVHSESGGYWVFIPVLINILVYSAIWFAIMSCVSAVFKSKKQSKIGE